MKYTPLPAPTGVRAALRAATDAVHQRMHGLKPFAAIADGALTAERYAQLLQSLLQFHSAVGAAARRHGWSNLSSASARTEVLRSDLRSLGYGAIRPLVGWEMRSPHEALGALYAAEGSMLGGRVIGGQLDYMFGSTQEGRRFFIGSRGDAARWRGLVAALEAHCAGTGALVDAIGGAHFAFDLFEECVMAPQPNAIAPAAAASGMTARTLNFERHR